MEEHKLTCKKQKTDSTQSHQILNKILAWGFQKMFKLARFSRKRRSKKPKSVWVFQKIPKIFKLARVFSKVSNQSELA